MFLRWLIQRGGNRVGQIKKL